ncbi:MAG: type II toxin-antitoxin system RelE/ParE family toxin [Phycisphaerae bacterium]|nr:type II toxin-antitoxin system RelE/ParE family toxin [Phycisphaerae bacterium]
MFRSEQADEPARWLHGPHQALGREGDGSAAERTFERVAQAILRLEHDPRPAGSKKLRGVQDYRLRVGQYRILYSVDDPERVVVVFAVGHRRDVYRGI